MAAQINALWCVHPADLHGDNFDGQLGIQQGIGITDGGSSTPVPVLGNTRFLQISVGDYHAAALVASSN